MSVVVCVLPEAFEAEIQSASEFFTAFRKILSASLYWRNSLVFGSSCQWI